MPSKAGDAVHLTVYFKTQNEFPSWVKDSGVEVTEVCCNDASGDPTYPVRIRFKGKVVDPTLWDKGEEVEEDEPC